MVRARHSELQTRSMPGLLVLLLTIGLFFRPAAAEERPFRIGFTTTMFSYVNEADAKAAIKGWGKAIASRKGVPLNPDSLVIPDTKVLIQAMRDKEVDAVAMTALEYNALRKVVALDHIMLNMIADPYPDTCVLLALATGPVKTLADMRGRRLIFHESPRSSLALPWLDLLLAEHGLPVTRKLVGKVIVEAKLPGAILPVFFGQTDACLVTRRGFEIMCDLNPQLRERLTVVAESAEIPPTLLAFRADFESVHKNVILDSLASLHEEPGGRQILTIFQSDVLRPVTESALDPVRELLTRHEMLKP